jgi:hypothetical protein
VRGAGGYVILPPSRRWPDGKAYEANQPLDPAAIAEAPTWLYELINPSRKTPAGGAEGAFLCTPENTRKLRDALFHILADARAMWLKIGGALNSLSQEWGSVARELWDEWCPVVLMPKISKKLGKALTRRARKSPPSRRYFPRQGLTGGLLNRIGRWR